MATISVRVSDAMKKEMENNPTINWSEVLRQAINQKLTKQRGSNLVKAVLINERIRKTAPKGWDSTDIIRKDRARKPKIGKT